MRALLLIGLSFFLAQVHCKGPIKNVVVLMLENRAFDHMVLSFAPVAFTYLLLVVGSLIRTKSRNRWSDRQRVEPRQSEQAGFETNSGHNGCTVANHLEPWP